MATMQVDLCTPLMTRGFDNLAVNSHPMQIEHAGSNTPRAFSTATVTAKRQFFRDLQGHDSWQRICSLRSRNDKLQLTKM
ncbi:hypothetical protein Ae201684P_002591 [Aphanomyces euteiches]|uniref:Uncharacterized protein n=1 Tax=Aphanomyces euteiches TaxID=100861 RepID=A0A6G0X2B9_9STRA|nr:hypothetical protein Ae201684_009481 [Aphanomyces euteiches]KAH9070225.1 hypothetical protein Ae201684P_002591 [Aphanomyces euteiches]